MPLPYDVLLGSSMQSYGGDARNTSYPIGPSLSVNWVVPANLFPGGRTQSVTVPLIPPGTKYLDRWTQVDLSLKKMFSFGRQRLEGSLDMFNFLNSNVVLTQNQSLRSAAGSAVIHPAAAIAESVRAVEILM